MQEQIEMVGFYPIEDEKSPKMLLDHLSKDGVEC